MFAGGFESDSQVAVKRENWARNATMVGPLGGALRVTCTKGNPPATSETAFCVGLAASLKTFHQRFNVCRNFNECADLWMPGSA